MVEKVPMTKGGYQRLTEELRHLKSTERPNIIKAIAEARAQGDLSENAEYHSAREKQSFIEGRIAELESKISLADVIDVSKLSGPMVRFGATVVLEDEDSGERVRYQIVGQDESDIHSGLLSVGAPLARALIGKSIDDSVQIRAPGGDKGYVIVDVAYKDEVLPSTGV
ncbi:MAG: transcription elongation factor GreA [Alphaproteobacteria bacterium]|nr:MAG: transcription elongation factor GreA [Alphaproteobacteria bacterium]